MGRTVSASTTAPIGLTLLALALALDPWFGAIDGNVPELVAIEALYAGFKIGALPRVVTVVPAEVAIWTSFTRALSFFLAGGSLSLLFFAGSLDRRASCRERVSSPV